VASHGIGEDGSATLASGTHLPVVRKLAQNNLRPLKETVLPVGGQGGEHLDALLGARQGAVALGLGQLQHGRHERRQDCYPDEDEPGTQSDGSDCLEHAGNWTFLVSARHPWPNVGGKGIIATYSFIYLNTTILSSLWFPNPGPRRYPLARSTMIGHD
jgi:hypothetical protein